jgi:diketogulonate reductase-like aldo/keto reductase
LSINPYTYKGKKKVLEYCHSKGTKIAAYDTLVSTTDMSGGPVDAVVTRIATELGVKEAQVLMKCAHLVTQGGIVLSSSCNREQLEDEIKVFTEMPDLTESHVQEIIKAGEAGEAGYSMSVSQLFR